MKFYLSLLLENMRIFRLYLANHQYKVADFRKKKKEKKKEEKVVAYHKVTGGPYYRKKYYQVNISCLWSA